MIEVLERTIEQATEPRPALAFSEPCGVPGVYCRACYRVLCVEHAHVSMSNGHFRAICPTHQKNEEK